MKPKRLLITGVSGLLGNNLAYCLKDRYQILGLYHSHKVHIPGIELKELDFLSPQAIRQVLEDFNPDILIHCGALSDVDFCEENPELAKKVNVLGTKILVQQLKKYSTKLIYISTDMVYDENPATTLSETARIHPPNHYAKTKYQGELEALKRKKTLVLRTNFFGWNIQDKFSLGEWIVYELLNQKEIQGFSDVDFSCIYTFELAKILEKAIRKDLKGTYNCASSSCLSKYEFARQIAEVFGLDPALIKPISVGKSPLKAQRRKNLFLDVNKIARDLKIKIPTIEESIQRFHEDYQSGVCEKIKLNRFGDTYPQVDFISYSRQMIDEQDIQAVVNTLKSSNLTQGPKIAEFENSLLEETGARYAVAVNSGTSALHIACLAAGIGPGDEVITSPNTFVASANCIAYCGGNPVFADIDAQTHNIAPTEIEKRINERTKAVIPVHFAGQICDMEAIRQIVQKKEKQYNHKITIIEDASHALGSVYKGKKAGACDYSDMTVMSFHPVKHITTAEGGAVSTNDKTLNDRLRRFRSHGITSIPEEFIFPEQSRTHAGDLKTWYYEQQFLGYNYRMTDVQGALGVSQMKKLPFFVKRRREIAFQYNKIFSDKKFITIPHEAKNCFTNWHLYVLNIDFKAAGIERAIFIKTLREKGILTQVHYIPVHTQPFYQKTFGYHWGDFPVTENYYEQCLSIPIFPMMTRQDVARVAKQILKVLHGGS